MLCQIVQMDSGRARFYFRPNCAVYDVCHRQDSWWLAFLRTSHVTFHNFQRRVEFRASVKQTRSKLHITLADYRHYTNLPEGLEYM